MLKSLKYILNFEWLAGIPMGAAKWVFLVLFILIGIAVLFIPNDYIYAGEQKLRWWLNLKLWALADLVFIFVVYYMF